MALKNRVLAETAFKGIKYIIILYVVIPRCDEPAVCGRAEYDSEHGCCPVCPAGYYVQRHCTDMTSTTCRPCPPSTFSDHPSGLSSCLSCTVCDNSEGLRQKRGCSPTSDTFCEPLEGHYCTNPTKDTCQESVEHSKCKPGQYVRQNGTTTSDTVCGDCGNHTYSDGSLTSCKPHTQCESLGMDVIQEGTSSTDTICGKSGISPTVVVVIVLVIVLVILAAVGSIIRILHPNMKLFQQVNEGPLDRTEPEDFRGQQQSDSERSGSSDASD